MKFLKKCKPLYLGLSVYATVAVLAAVALLLALVIETGIFHFSYFTQYVGEYYFVYDLDLSSMDGFDGTALVIGADESSVTFENVVNGFQLPVRSVTVTTAGESGIITGTVSVMDEANAFMSVDAAAFSVNPGGEENSFTVRIKSNGSLYRFSLDFDEALENDLYITSVSINPHESLDLNMFRVLIFFGIIFLILICVRFKPYTKIYDPARPAHFVLNLGVAALCLAVCACVIRAENPTGEFLRTYPSLEELRDYEDMYIDPYIQQLDAFEKGMVELDLDVSEELLEMDNPYDTGERMSKGVMYHWDRAYYNGKYYSYYGLAPLITVYYPVYLLTGSLPQKQFALGVTAFFAIVWMFAAMDALVRMFKIRANLLLFLFGEAAVVSGSLIYAALGNASFYYIPVASAIGWLAAFLALSMYAVMCRRSVLRAVLFALSGCSFVMIVMSRPGVALLAVLFAIPLFISVLRDGTLSMRSRIAGSALPFMVPVLAGGIFVMYFNFIRFGSPFEFGNTYQLTLNNMTYASAGFSMSGMADSIYHYFLQEFEFSEYFPFINYENELCMNYGNYIYSGPGAGLLSLPMNLCIFLLVPFLAFDKKYVGCANVPTLKWILALSTAGLVVLGYVNYMLGGVDVRYVCDLAFMMSLLSFVLILIKIHPKEDGTLSMSYIICLLLAAVTFIYGLLLIFSSANTFIYIHNPDLYLRISRILEF